VTLSLVYTVSSGFLTWFPMKNGMKEEHTGDVGEQGSWPRSF
jgi:hypothetical protein